MRQRTPLDAAAGQLISAIQKVGNRQWDDMDRVHFVEAVMNRAHQVLEAAIRDELPQLLAGRSMSQFLDAGWLLSDPGVGTAFRTLESMLDV